MQHTHELRLKDQCVVINDPSMHTDIQLWLKCGFSVAQITKTLQQKYQKVATQILYQDVYNLVRQFKQVDDDGTAENKLAKPL